jgi:hypothetical protein
MLYCLPFWVVRSRLTAIELGDDAMVQMVCSPGERAEDWRGLTVGGSAPA